MASLASAFVNIIPGTKEIDKYLKTDLPGDAAKAGGPVGNKLGTSVGTGFGTKFKAALGPIIATAAAAFGAMAIGNFIKDGITGATDLKTALTEVVTLTGSVGDAAAADFKSFQDTVKGVSTEFGIAQDVLTNGLYNAISAGIPRGNVLEFMQVASQASIAGVTDVNTAVDGLSTVLNAFGLEADATQAVADSMFTAVKGGKTTFAELSASMFQVAPSAAAAGVSFTEVNAAIATLTAAGTPTTVATTQIKAALTALQRPTADMTALFNGLGYESAQAAIESEGLQFALGAVSDYADGNNGKMIELLGSVEAVSAVQVLAGTGAEKFTSELAAQADAAGSTQTAFEELDATRSAERNKIAFDNLTLAIGTALLPVAVGLTDFLGTTFVPFMENTLAPAFTNISDFIVNDFVPAFMAITDWIVDNLPTIITFIAVLGGLLIFINKAAVATKILAVVNAFLNATLLSNPLTLVAIAIALLIAGIVYLITETTFFQDTWAAMTEFAAKAWEGFKQLFMDAVEAIGDFFGTIVDNIKESWEKMTDALGGAWEKFTDFIGGIWDGFKENFDKVVNGFKSLFETVWNGIGNFFKGVINGYIGMFENFINFVISGANMLIRALNKIKINIPATPFSGAFSIGVNLAELGDVNLPRLAKGGYVEEATTAIIGEAGPEVVTPLKDFERMMGIGQDSGKTINYYAAPNQSIDAEQALFTAMRRAKVVANW
jgi:TP901 family phage tail tape measure protein